MIDLLPRIFEASDVLVEFLADFDEVCFFCILFVESDDGSEDEPFEARFRVGGMWSDVLVCVEFLLKGFKLNFSVFD